MCCQGQGGIFLTAEQAPAAAAELNMDTNEFTAAFCQAVDGRWEVLVNAEGYCRLLGDEGCMIHEAKPEICQRWPYFKNILAKLTAFEDARQACPGIDPDISYEDFVAHARAQGYLE